MIKISSHHSYIFLFNDTATTEIYTLSLHDALPISKNLCANVPAGATLEAASYSTVGAIAASSVARSEEHTSELQSRVDLVCRLLLEKKKTLTAEGHNWSVRRVDCL